MVDAVVEANVTDIGGIGIVVMFDTGIEANVTDTGVGGIQILVLVVLT